MRVALVNPPFASIRRPSLALTQLKWAVRQALPKVDVDIHYLNLDIGALVGRPLYDAIAYFELAHSGLGEWLFRGQAFPDTADNAASYLAWLEATQTLPEGVTVASIIEARERITHHYPALVAGRGLAAYDVVGATTMFQQTLPALAMFHLVKTANPRVVTVLGGANCEATMGAALAERLAIVDVVVDGEALESFPRLLARLDVAPGDRGRRDVPRLVTARPGTRETTASPATRVTFAARPGIRSRPPSLGNLPYLDYDDFFTEREACLPGDDDVAISFESSKGCWWGERVHCTFCGLNGATMAFRAATPDDVVAYLDDLVSRYRDVCQEFDAVDNIMARNYIDDVLPRLQVPDGVSLFYELKANLRDDQVATLASARVLRIQPGIEALSTEALRLMRKGNNAFQNVALLRSCRDHGLTVVWNILVGIPGESQRIYDTYAALLPTLKHLPPPAGVFPLQFHRFSPYHRNPADFGLTLMAYPYYSYLFPFDDPDWLDRVAYHFSNTNLAAPYLRLLARNLPTISDLVAEWRDSWWSSGRRPRLDAREEEGGTRIVDTRDGGTPADYMIEGEAATALELFASPRPIAQVVGLLGDTGVSSDSSRRAVQTLRDRRLLFEEGSSALALTSVRDHDSSRGGRAPQTARFDRFMGRYAQSRRIAASSSRPAPYPHRLPPLHRP